MSETQKPDQSVPDEPQTDEPQAEPEQPQKDEPGSDGDGGQQQPQTGRRPDFVADATVEVSKEDSREDR